MDIKQFWVKLDLWKALFKTDFFFSLNRLSH